MWRIVPHNLKLRQVIRKGSDSRCYKGAFDPNPIEAYRKQKLSQAKHTRKAATKLAQAMRALTPTSMVHPPAGSPKAQDKQRGVVAQAPPAVSEMDCP